MKQISLVFRLRNANTVTFCENDTFHIHKYYRCRLPR